MTLRPATQSGGSKIPGWLVLFLAIGLSQTRMVAAEQGAQGPPMTALEALAREAIAVQDNRTNAGPGALDQARPQSSANQEPMDPKLALVLVLGGILTMRVVGPRLGKLCHRRFDPWASRQTGHDEEAEERAFSDFAERFVAGPGSKTADEAGEDPDAPATYVVEADSKSPDKAEKAEGRARSSRPAASAAAPGKAGRHRGVAQSIPKELAVLRPIVSNLGSATDPAVRQKSIEDLAKAVALLNKQAEQAELRPCWQLTAALQGLLEQLARKPAEVSSSALRTAANALDLLNSLWQPGIKPDLATAPAVRVLVADDDAICRHAMSSAVQKVFGPPDLATDGHGALAQASEIAYDVIFLDVEMPVMDGFELCSRIRKRASNGETPVVFVTRHSDFDSRAKSTLSGGSDLIGKPFLSFEIALKAITLVMRRRLDQLS